MEVVAIIAVAAAFILVEKNAGSGQGANRPILIFGHEVEKNAEELIFSGDEITDITALESGLKELGGLRKVDLGSFHMFDEELEALRAEFPDVDFICVTYKRVAGTVCLATDEEIDLEGKDVDFGVLADELSGLRNLRHVTFGNDAVRASEMEKLKGACPDVEFTAVLTYPVGDAEFREDAASIDISGKPLPDGLSAALSHFKSLTNVDLTGTGADVGTLIELKKSFPSVAFHAEVELGGETFDSDVEEIDLNSKEVGDFDLFFASAALFNNLKKIEMCDCGFSNEQMETLRDAYPNTKFVWRVYLGKWSLRTDAVAFSVLIMAYDEYERMTTEDIQVLKYCTDLQALDLGHQDVSDISVIGDYLTELRILILVDNKVTDLSPLAKLKHLHYLEFFVNRVNDITPLASCRELVDLNMGYNGITDITPLLDLPLLERLWFEHTLVSARDVQLLKETYPNATIISVGEGSVDQGWRAHARYRAMIDMFNNNFVSEEFSKYDGKA